MPSDYQFPSQPENHQDQTTARLHFSIMSCNILLILGLTTILPAIAVAGWDGHVPLGEDGAQVRFYDQSLAICIGISYANNPDWAQLDQAPVDARDFAEVLRSDSNGHGFDKVVLLVEEPTKTEIIDAMRNISKLCTPETRLVVFYSGHGDTAILANGERAAYIIPSNAPQTSGDPDELEQHAINLDYFRSNAKIIKARHVFYILDCCYSGNLVFSMVNRSRTAVEVPKRLTERMSGDCRQFLTSGSDIQQTGNRSDFAGYLITGLQGYADIDDDGWILGSELAAYVKDNVGNSSLGRIQYPQYTKSNEPNLGLGDMIFKCPDFIGKTMQSIGNAYLEIKSNIPDLKVLLNYIEQTEKTPCKIPLAPGEYKIELQHSDEEYYIPYITHVNLVSGHTTTVSGAVSRRNGLGILKVISKLSGTVYIDDEIVGNVREEIQGIEAGSHSLKVDPYVKSYNDFEQIIVIKEDFVNEIPVRFPGEDTSSLISCKFTSAPPGAVIRVNGTRLGITPDTFSLPSGTIELELDHPDCKLYQETVEVAPQVHRKLEELLGILTLSCVDNMGNVTIDDIPQQVKVRKDPLDFPLSKGYHRIRVEPTYRKDELRVWEKTIEVNPRRPTSFVIVFSAK